MLDEILTDADGDEEQLWALRQALDDNVGVPCDAMAAGETVKLTKFDYGGNSRRGLTATILSSDGSKHVVSAADVLLGDASSQTYVAAYRKWMGVTPFPAKPPRAKTSGRATIPAPAENPDVAVLSLSARTARCKVLSSGEAITLRSARLCVVPGEIATVKPDKRWIYGGHPHVSGSIESIRLEPKALGLTPLRPEPRGDWDPAEQYWGDAGGRGPAWARKIIQHGRRPRFEMEQVIPGDDPGDPWNDPIIKSNDKKNAGDYSGAYDLLMGLCLADLRCLDAHAHLGNLSFDTRPKDAIRHYEVGVRIGELLLPADFNGVLPWAMIDNRPFLRCLNGYGLCLWRLERFKESAAVFKRLLWLNPSDNQGVRLLMDDVRKQRAWRPDDW